MRSEALRYQRQHDEGESGGGSAANSSRHNIPRVKEMNGWLGRRSREQTTCLRRQWKAGGNDCGIAMRSVPEIRENASDRNNLMHHSVSARVDGCWSRSAIAILQWNPAGSKER